MNEFISEWGDGSLTFENVNGIPIPRGQSSSFFLRPAFGDQFICDNSGNSPSRHMVVPPNSLNQDIPGQMSNAQEIQRSSVSPYYSGDSPISGINSGQYENDVEIKMEPMDEMIDIGMAESNLLKSGEDNLLDNVNFEDLLMSDDMDSSTTCLDPQHSSPAAMATVHPDEVLGMMRINNCPTQVPDMSTPSNNVPVKIEHVHYECPATSFPPHGLVWKDSSRFHPVLGSLNFHPNFHSGHSLNSGDKMGFPGLLEQRVMSGNSDMSPQECHQRTSDYSSGSGHSELHYTQLEPVSNSALHDLLVNSPSTSQSVHSHVSPVSNLSPLSPVRDHFLHEIPTGQSVPGMQSFLTHTSPNLSSRLSSSAPVNNFPLDQIWQRRETRQHLLSTGSLVEEVGGSTSSLSTGGGIVSPVSYDFSIDEGIDSDSDVDRFDSDSDNESLLSEDLIAIGGQGPGGKKERHFWQYNVQAKGPKGQRVNITHRETNPYDLGKITDPVFSPLCSVQGIKHSGKARRGDGNDLTPSPRKLVNIGIELNKLNKKINDMTPVSELPSTIRSKSRKEKNKLASRACRLKKKAQHEANKIKLYGLEQEHKSVMSAILEVREALMNKVDAIRDSGEASSELSQLTPERSQYQMMVSSSVDQLVRTNSKPKIAGMTTEFVNKVIEICRNGDPSGGLNDLSENFVKKMVVTNEPGTSLNYNNQLYT